VKKESNVGILMNSSTWKETNKTKKRLKGVQSAPGKPSAILSPLESKKKERKPKLA
jgi:hypothetical protein